LRTTVDSEGGGGDEGRVEEETIPSSTSFVADVSAGGPSASGGDVGRIVNRSRLVAGLAAKESSMPLSRLEMLGD